MTQTHPPVSRGQADTFHREASAGTQGMLREFARYLACTKKWWLAPIIIVLLMVGVLVLLTSNPVTAPFIYTLF